MRYLHPKILLLVVPALMFTAYLLLLGVNHMPRSLIERAFPLSLLILVPFVLGYVGGLVVALAAMLWALVCCFLRFDGKRPVLLALTLFLIAFVSAGLFGTAIQKLSNLPTPSRPSSPTR